MNSCTHGSCMIKRPHSPTQSRANITEGLSVRLTCRHVKAKELCSFSVTVNPTTSLLWLLGWMHGGCGNSLDIYLRTSLHKSTPTQQAWDEIWPAKQSSRGKLRGQTSLHHQNLSCVCVKIPSVLLTQSSLTLCRKDLSAQCASLSHKYHLVYWISSPLRPGHVRVGKKKPEQLMAKRKHSHLFKRLMKMPRLRDV